ncbi:MAG: acetyl-CoA carboxylase biotin carboxyl carrier protein [Epsilonproteobacteria bacterium]|nr:acetyl-CoA carboxylase biotin carboxyl carrier protein [Campylobacterota bacterium]
MKLEEIKEIIRYFGKSKLNKLKIKDKDFEISMEKEEKIVQANITPSYEVVEKTMESSVQNQPVKEEKKESKSQEGELITSPMVGTFYRAPSPDSPPFVEVGDKVKKGQTLCILEAMKIMNELEAEFDCEILDILVQDGEPVEYDTPLFRVKRL